MPLARYFNSSIVFDNSRFTFYSWAFNELSSLMEISITLQTSDIDFDIDFMTSTIFYEGSSKSFSTYTRLEAKTNSVTWQVRNNIVMFLIILSRLKNPLWVRSPAPSRIFAKVSFCSLSHESVLLLFMRVWDTKIFRASGALSYSILDLLQSRAKNRVFSKTLQLVVKNV